MLNNSNNQKQLQRASEPTLAPHALQTTATTDGAVQASAAAATSSSGIITIEPEEISRSKELYCPDNYYEEGFEDYSIVYQGKWKTLDVAIKEFQVYINNPYSPATIRSQKSFENECLILSNLNSPYIVQFYGRCFRPVPCIVMEYMPNGSLYNALKGSQELSWTIRLAIAKDMIYGVGYLHQNNVVYCDMKSPNVLLNKSWGAKLCDFDLSKIQTHHSQASSPYGYEIAEGTIEWRAPELFHGRSRNTQQSDIYSLGVTLWELATRKIPSRRQTDFSSHISQDCPPKLSTLIQACCDEDPKKRPNAKQITDYWQSEKNHFTEFSQTFLPSYQLSISMSQAGSSAQPENRDTQDNTDLESLKKLTIN